MIFFTRELYRGVQPKSGWERRAIREWDRRADTYSRYADVVAPMLPATVRRLTKETLHDGVVREASLGDGELVLVVDATHALGGFRGRRVRLAFRDVRGRPAVAKLVGEWWLYEEAHLSARSKFALHVLFDKSELVVEAGDLALTLLPR